MDSKVKISKSQLDHFKRVARKNSPLEVLAYLVGKVVSPTLTVVHRTEYTKDYYEQTPTCISWTVEEYDRIRKKAEEEGLTIVGDIHSHPNYWPVLSPQDHKSHVTDQLRLCGIYGFMGIKGKVCFWVVDSALPLQIEDYVEKRPKPKRTKRLKND